MSREAVCGVALFMAGCTGALPTQDAVSPRASSVSPAPIPTADRTTEQLVNTAWRVTSGNRAPGTLFVFLSNGTLVMTSCVEVYRLATWRAETTDRLTIVEDATVQYTADIRTLSQNSLSLRLNLRSEQVDLTLEAAQAPFVCPDLPR
jgi:hypothetical protein